MSLKGILANLEPNQFEELVERLRATDKFSKLIDQVDSPSDILNIVENKIGGDPDGVLRQLISMSGIDTSEAKLSIDQLNRLTRNEDSQVSEMIENATETVSEAVIGGVSEAGDLLGAVAEAGGDLLSTVGEASGELLSTIAEFLLSL